MLVNNSARFSCISFSCKATVAHCNTARLRFGIMGFLKRFRRARSNKESSESPANQSQSNFFTIPGEIRNHIYRLVLVSNQRIHITSTPTPEPALLKTCRATRREAATIYYLENRFSIDCPNWRYSVYQNFFKKFDQHVPKSNGRCTKIIWTNTGSWTCKANLMDFLKAFHAGRVKPGFKYPISSSDESCEAIARAFEIVRTMKKRRWRVVNKALHIHLNEAVKGLDWEWD